MAVVLLSSGLVSGRLARLAPSDRFGTEHFGLRPIAVLPMRRGAAGHGCLSPVRDQAAFFFVAVDFFARNAAQRFLVASAIALRPAALIVRFFTGAFFSAGVAPCRLWNAAQRFRCAAAIRAFAAPLILRRGFALSVATEAESSSRGACPSSSLRISAIFSSIFCCLAS